jgi:hypothetical protein
MDESLPPATQPGKLKRVVQSVHKLWDDVRGNAKWDAIKTGACMSIAAFWLVIRFLRQGPALQVYGLMGIATASILVFLLFGSKIGRWISGILAASFILLLVMSLVSFYDKTNIKPENIPSNSFTGTNSGQVFQNSTNSGNQIMGSSIAGDVAQFANSPGAIANFKPKPFIAGTSILSNNVEISNGVFKTIIIERIGNPPQEPNAVVTTTIERNPLNFLNSYSEVYGSGFNITTGQP